MVTLRNFSLNDALVLKNNLYGNCEIEEINKMILQWNTKKYGDKYFETFSICSDNEVVGMVSLFEKSENIVSIGVEVFERYQKKGYGEKALTFCLEIAKHKGYSLVVQQIRTDNEASITLHKKLGFDTDGYVYLNKKGNEVLVFIKSI